MNEIPQLRPEGLKNNLDLRGDSPWINNVNTRRQPFIEVFCVRGLWMTVPWDKMLSLHVCEGPQVTFVSETD